MQPLFGAPVSAPLASYQSPEMMMMQQQPMQQVYQPMQPQPPMYGGMPVQSNFGQK
jgi:hypothetical protein